VRALAPATLCNPRTYVRFSLVGINEPVRRDVGGRDGCRLTKACMGGEIFYAA